MTMRNMSKKKDKEGENRRQQMMDEARNEDESIQLRLRVEVLTKEEERYSMLSVFRFVHMLVDLARACCFCMCCVYVRVFPVVRCRYQVASYRIILVHKTDFGRSVGRCSFG
jgi:hypothetical protein